MSRHRTIVAENSPVAPEPTEEELKASMGETSTAVEEKEEETPKETPKAEPQKREVVGDLKDVDKVMVGGKTYSKKEVEEIIKLHAKGGTPLLPDDKPSKPGMMLTANCTLKISKVGSTVPLLGVTPAEVMFLSAEHHAEAGGNPITKLEVVGEESRTSQEELARLRSKYRHDKLSKMFPGAMPQMPTTFKEAVEIGTNTTLPESKLTEVDLAKV